MAASKKKGKRKVKKKSPSKKKPLKKAEEYSPGPHYVVQIGDPKMLRKDLLETLRDIIVFMQGYEEFRKIQEKKVAVFAQMEADVKSLGTLISRKLRRHLPKGNLEPKKFEPMPEAKPEASNDWGNEEMPLPELPELPARTSSSGKKAPEELDELDVQLQDIEKQLQNM